MQQAIAGQANTIVYDVINASTVLPVTSGTVTGYLRARDGGNADKWWNAGGASWSDTEASSGAMSYVAGAAWKVSIAAGAWANGVTYDFYAKESGDLGIVYSEQVATWSPPTTGRGGDAWTYTVTDSSTAQPIADCEVWATTDAPGVNIICHAYTNVSGVVTFYLPSGTYYIWRRAAGYTFTNPDTEII